MQLTRTGKSPRFWELLPRLSADPSAFCYFLYCIRCSFLQSAISSACLERAVGKFEVSGRFGSRRATRCLAGARTASIPLLWLAFILCVCHHFTSRARSLAVGPYPNHSLAGQGGQFDIVLLSAWPRSTGRRNTTPTSAMPPSSWTRKVFTRSKIRAIQRPRSPGRGTGAPRLRSAVLS